MNGFGDYYGESSLHPVGFLSIVVLGITLLLVPRQYAVWPMIIMGCFIPSAQRVVLAGADFTLLRILVVFGWTRLLVRNEFRNLRWNSMDSLVVSWMLVETAIFTVQYGTSAAIINRCGWLFEGLGMYFIFRCVLREWSDLSRVTQAFVLVSIPVAIGFVVEWSTGRNIFAVFGGVRAVTWIREGRLRCQGAFAHPILAGCFWASVMPLMFAYIALGKRWVASAGLVSSLIVIVACASSTPILALGFVAVGMAMYPLRRYLSFVLWGTVASLVVLHFAMEKPVWHLLARVSAVGGSTGWHRYKILDTTILHFTDWALLGESNPMRWGVWNMRDITNQYILEALRGGVITLILFVAMLTTGFRLVGKTMERLEGNPQQTLFAWCVGVGLFVHAGAFFGVSYFGQINMLIYLNLAMIGSMYAMVSRIPTPGTQDYEPEGGREDRLPYQDHAGAPPRTFHANV